MTDEELLKAAARVAEIELHPTVPGAPLWIVGRGIWNPLDDDGDALRLAVDIGLVVCVLHEIQRTGVYLPAEHIGGKYDVVEPHGDDPYAATRRAIVRAAAEMAKPRHKVLARCRA